MLSTLISFPLQLFLHSPTTLLPCFMYSLCSCCLLTTDNNCSSMPHVNAPHLILLENRNLSWNSCLKITSLPMTLPSNFFFLIKMNMVPKLNPCQCGEKKSACQRSSNAGVWYVSHSCRAHRMAFLRTFTVIPELQSFWSNSWASDTLQNPFCHGKCCSREECKLWC